VGDAAAAGIGQLQNDAGRGAVPQHRRRHGLVRTSLVSFSASGVNDHKVLRKHGENDQVLYLNIAGATDR
jgi:hypothetical protein